MATFTVTEQAATGAGSLAAAIAAAEASAGPDTIVFDPSVTRIVTSGTLTINSNITIDGDRNNDGIADVTLSSDIDADGTGNHTLFVLGTGANATFDGLILTKGMGVGATTDGVAGAILNNGTATIRNSQFVDNQAYGMAGQQGTDGSTGNLSGGDGGDGGGAAGAILNRGIMSIQNTVFSNNTGVGGNGGGGGYGATEYVMIGGHPIPIGGGGGGDGGYGGYGAGAIVNSSAGSLTLSAGVVLSDNTGAAGNGGSGGDAGTASFDPGGSAGTGAHGSASILDFGTMSGTATLNGGTFSGGVGGGFGDPPSEYDYPFIRPDGFGGLQPVRIGTAGSDVKAGLAFSEFFAGLTGDDTFVVSAGNDEFNGGSGNDTVDLSALAGAITFNLSSTAAQSIGIGTLKVADVENVIGGSGNDTITGNDAVNRLEGRNGNDTLDGGLGADTMDGGSGNDTYYVDNANDIVIEAAGAGSDRIFTSLSFTLAAGVEIETLATTNSAGTDAINLTGNAFGQTLIGNAANNVLDGKGGADTMQGMGGNDWYYVDNAGDKVIEAAGNGAADRVFTSVSYTLTAGAEIEFFTTTSNVGTGAINLTGNEFGQTIYGNAGANILDGGKGGSDTLYGLDGDDTFLAWSGDDTFNGDNGTDTVSFAGWTSGVNIDLSLATAQAVSGGSVMLSSIENIIGGNGNDIVKGNGDGGALSGGLGGNDQLSGGAGNDTFLAWSGADTFDGGNGTDTVSFAGWTSGVSINLDLATAQAVSGGSVKLSSIETVIGGNSNDTLRGSTGANVLSGGDGNDTFLTWSGADTFNGGNGTDTLSFAGWTSGVSINLDLTNAQAVAGGSVTLSSIETVIGGNGADTLRGSTGNNVLSGGNGNDTFLAWSGADTFNGGSGTDMVSFAGWSSGVTIDLNLTTVQAVSGGSVTLSSIETVIGGNGSDTLRGSAGANVLSGGKGSDMLTGRGGADTFVFDTALGAANVDNITDFTVIDDTIQLAHAIFTGIGANQTLSAAAFVIGAAATNANQRIIYNSTTGNLYFDDDGNGAHAAQQFGHISAGLALTNADFYIA